MYRVVRPLLYALPAEFAHHLAFFLLRVWMAIPGVAALYHRRRLPNDEALAVEALGLRFANPVGLAAGFDKDARGYDALSALGFGHVEIGTLTARAQPGNPKPRLFRLVPDKALLNRMGFNNAGAHAAVARLTRPRRAVVGVNIGKSKLASEAEAIDDYRESARTLAPYADYFVVNVSSPNTPGLRDLQATDKLRPLLVAVREALTRGTHRHVPLLLKIAPDLADADIDAIADLAADLALDGLIATNTTISREGLVTPRDRVEALGAGGISGAPVRERSVQVLARLRARLGDRLILISVGGIASAEEAWTRIRAGASLVQLYTGLIYEGPGLPWRIARGLRAIAQREGFARIQDAIGCDVRATEGSAGPSGPAPGDVAGANASSRTHSV